MIVVSCDDDELVSIRRELRRVFSQQMVLRQKLTTLRPRWPFCIHARNVQHRA